MIKTVFFNLIFLLPLTPTGINVLDGDWIVKGNNGYNLYYTTADIDNESEYNSLIKVGIRTTFRFFKIKYQMDFNIFIHPDRRSLDSAWQNAWNLPEFKSACWMVASGVADRLDIISPKMWDNQSCEHHYLERENTQQLITHELVHVYHAQCNPSKDFSNTTGIDWFVEGLATYASGQCNQQRITEIVHIIKNNSHPISLEDFWKGTFKYSLCGTMVLFIDKTYGRMKLTELLSLTTKNQLLIALDISESLLLLKWQNYMLQTYGNN